MTLGEMQQKKYEIADEIIMSNERAMLRQYRARRDEILTATEQFYTKHLIQVDPADYMVVSNQYNRLKTIGKDFKGIFTNLNRETSTTAKAGQMEIFEECFYRDQYAMTFFADRAGGEIKRQALNPLINELSVTGDLDLYNKIRKDYPAMARAMLPASGETLTGLLAKHNTKGLVDVIQQVKQGLINGDSFAKQERRIRKVFNNNYANAIRVIRTEGTRNMNAGAYANALTLSEQIPIMRQWAATLDGRTRDRHGFLDGQQVEAGKPFRISGQSALYPGQFPDVAMNVNCRCTVLDLPKGAKLTLRRGIDPVTGKSEIGSYKNYSEWRKSA